MSSSLRARYSGSCLRPRCPRVWFWTRRRTSSSVLSACRTTWERVRDLACVIQRRVQRRPIQSKEVQGHPTNVYPPARRLVEQPSRGCCGCSVRHYVQQFPAGDVDNAGRPRLVFEPAGATEQGLVETHRCRCADPVSVEQRLTPAQHRVVHRRPATRQVRSDIAHRTATADLACRPTRCSCRQQRPLRRDLVVVLSRRTRAAILTRASPSTFVPHQPRRAAKHRQIHQLHCPVSFGPQLAATTRTRRTRSPASHTQPQRPAATVVVDAQHVDFADTYQQLAHAYRVTHHTDPPVLDVVYDPDSGGSHPTDRGHPTTPTPTSNAKSPQRGSERPHRGSVPSMRVCKYCP